MKNKCKCYHTQKETRYTYHPLSGCPIPHIIDKGVCWGTKEADECNCGGDETQCDFYPEVRKKAREKQKNNMTENADLKEKEIETNADKIRSMNDEELAKLLAEAKYNNKKLDMDEVCHKGMCLDGETCVGCMLKWLKKPTAD